MSSGPKFDTWENVLLKTVSNPHYARELKDSYEIGIRKFFGLNFIQEDAPECPSYNFYPPAHYLFWWDEEIDDYKTM